MNNKRNGAQASGRRTPIDDNSRQGRRLSNHPPRRLDDAINGKARYHDTGCALPNNCVDQSPETLGTSFVGVDNVVGVVGMRPHAPTGLDGIGTTVSKGNNVGWSDKTGKLVPKGFAHFVTVAEIADRAVAKDIVRLFIGFRLVVTGTRHYGNIFGPDTVEILKMAVNTIVLVLGLVGCLAASADHGNNAG